MSDKIGNRPKPVELKVLRIRRGLRQYDVAARLGIHPGRLSEIESGRRTPSLELLDKLLALLRENSGAGAH